MAKGAIVALIVLIISIVFALPDEINIGVIFLDSFKDSVCPATPLNVACQQIDFYIVMLRLVSVLLFISDIIYIFTALKRGNF